MTGETWVGLLGGLAALCTTGAFVPQVVRTWRQGGRDLSYALLVLLLVGTGLWLAYGLLADDPAVVAANGATWILLALVFLLKWRGESPRLAGNGQLRRLRIAIDMDEVIADTLGHILAAYNQAFGETLTREDLRDRTLEEVVPAERAAALSRLVLAPDFFRDIPVIPGSQEVVRALAARYEVFIATAAMEVPHSFADKFDWLDEHFPFIPPSHRVFCGDKGVLDADYLIDDSPRQFARFRGTPVLFSAPHNREETRYLRVSDWQDVRRLLLKPPAAPAVPAPAPDLATTV
jgi:5'-nucleotidase